MAFLPVDTNIIERIFGELNRYSEDGLPAFFRDLSGNEQPIQDSTDPESNDPDYIDLDYPDYKLNINGTPFNFMSESRMLFDKLFFYSSTALQWPFIAERILKSNLNCQIQFVEYKCSEHPSKSVTSTQRIVAYILSIMPVNVKQSISTRILTKGLRQRRHAGPVRCSAQRPRRTGRRCQEIITIDFFEYFSESPETITNSTETYRLDFARRRTSPEELQLYSRIIRLERHVLSHLKNVKKLSDITLNQYESGNLYFKKTHNLLLCYLVMMEMRKEGIKEEETYEELALIVANNCTKYMLCTFKILDLRDKLNIFSKSGSYIQNLIFLFNIHRKMDVEVKNISMNIRLLVRVARNYLFWTK